MDTQDTIVAISSAPGAGARGILRLSGMDAWKIAAELTQGLPSEISNGCHGVWLRDPCLPAKLMGFRSPHSFTGEDVVEFHVPGSHILLKMLQDQVHAAGARPAGPGEFSARAFFNGKIDLTEAEGIAATIAAKSATELRAAASLREGNLHRKIFEITETVANLLALIEAGIDFSDEPGVSFVSADVASERLNQLVAEIDATLRSSVRIDRLDAPPTVVLIGKPNVGKSSLINALVGRERAIVSPVAGTTRDALAAMLRTPDGEIRVVDLAGEEVPMEGIGAEMMDTRRRAVLEADLIIHVIDNREMPLKALPDWVVAASDLIVVQNKADLLDPDQIGTGDWFPAGGGRWVQVSAKTGYNIDQLRTWIGQLAIRKEAVVHGQMVLNQRHRLILQDLKTTVWRAAMLAHRDKSFEQTLELLAADLRQALDLLGQITGAISPDDILGRIFSTFCIGK